MFVRVRLTGRTATRHRASLELETVVGGNKAYALVDEVDWTGTTFQTLRAAIPASQVPTEGSNRLAARVTSYNEFDAQPNHIFVDWAEYSFVRELAATGGVLRFSFEDGTARRMHLKGFGNEPLLVFNPADRRVFELTPNEGSATFTDQSTDVYWATSASAIHAPSALSLDRSSDWASVTNEADYVIITPRALRASADIMADYRRFESGFRVAVVDIQDIYDQFDYGRPTPIAIRRFVYQMQRWRTRPRFLLFWGDAYYANRSQRRPSWEVPSYGKASSDGWFAMQYSNSFDSVPHMVRVGQRMRSQTGHISTARTGSRLAVTARPGS